MGSRPRLSPYRFLRLPTTLPRPYCDLTNAPESRLSSLSKLLNITRAVCFCVLDKETSNTAVVSAFHTLQNSLSSVRKPKLDVGS